MLSFFVGYSLKFYAFTAKKAIRIVLKNHDFLLFFRLIDVRFFHLFMYFFRLIFDVFFDTFLINFQAFCITFLSSFSHVFLPFKLIF